MAIYVALQKTIGSIYLFMNKQIFFKYLFTYHFVCLIIVYLCLHLFLYYLFELLSVCVYILCSYSFIYLNGFRLLKFINRFTFIVLHLYLFII